MHFLLVQQEFDEDVAIGFRLFLVEYDLQIGSHWRNFEIGPMRIERFVRPDSNTIIFDAHQCGQRRDIGVVGETHSRGYVAYGTCFVGAFNDVAQKRLVTDFDCPVGI